MKVKEVLFAILFLVFPLKIEASLLIDITINTPLLFNERFSYDSLVSSIKKAFQKTPPESHTLPNNDICPACEDDTKNLLPDIESYRDHEIIKNNNIWSKDNSIILTDYYSNNIAKEAVDRQILHFSERLKISFAQWLSLSAKYLPLMRNILTENGLPEDLVFLPFIESGFNLNAYSPSHAAGPWQFMQATAKRYGLKINFWIDERRDPIKSTQAASRYIKDLYERFGYWDLVIAAYNAGERRIIKAIRRTKSDNFWYIYNTRYIKRETRHHVPRFLAAREIATEPEDYGFNKLDYFQPLEYDLVSVKTPADLSFIAKVLETSISNIKELNPELNRWCLPRNTKEYSLRIPPDTKDQFLYDYNNTPIKKRYKLDSYKVKKGDTPSEIAKKERIPLNVLYELNKIKNPKRIRAGSVLFLPPKNNSLEKKNLFERRVKPLKKFKA